jgi:hypothetical protein
MSDIYRHLKRDRSRPAFRGARACLPRRSGWRRVPARSSLPREPSSVRQYIATNHACVVECASPPVARHSAPARRWLALSNGARLVSSRIMCQRCLSSAQHSAAANHACVLDCGGCDAAFCSCIIGNGSTRLTGLCIPCFGARPLGQRSLSAKAIRPNSTRLNQIGPN